MKSPQPSYSSPRHRNLLPDRFWQSTAAWDSNSRFRRSRIDHPLYFRHTIRRKAALLGVFPHHGFIGRNIHAIDFVRRNKTLDPLDLWRQVLENAARLL